MYPENKYPVTTQSYLDLSKLREMVFDCVIKDKSRCLYPAVRSHYVDIRSSPEYPNLVSRMESTLKMLKGRPSGEIMKILSGSVKDLFLWISEDYQKLSLLTQKPVFISKIYKQLEQIEEKYKNSITKLVTVYIDKYNSLFKSIPKYSLHYAQVYEYYNYIELVLKELNVPFYRLEKTSFIHDLKLMYRNMVKINLYEILRKKDEIAKKEEITEGEESIENIGKNLFFLLRSIWEIFRLDIGADLHDIYTLTRMFRKFTQTDNSISIPPRNIIFYGGSSHSENLMYMILSLGMFERFDFKGKEGKEGPGCIDIRSMGVMF